MFVFEELFICFQNVSLEIRLKMMRFNKFLIGCMILQMISITIAMEDKMCGANTLCLVFGPIREAIWKIWSLIDQDITFIRVSAPQFWSIWKISKQYIYITTQSNRQWLNLKCSNISPYPAKIEMQELRVLSIQL